MSLRKFMSFWKCSNLEAKIVTHLNLSLKKKDMRSSFDLQSINLKMNPLRWFKRT